MKNDRIVAAWDEATPDSTERKLMLQNIMRATEQPIPPSRPWLKILIPALAVVLVAAVVIPLVAGRSQRIDLDTSTPGVKAAYVRTPSGFAASFDLVPMTEDELLAGADIFQGVVTKASTIKVTFSDWSDEMTVLTVRISDVITGDLSVGEEVTILSHPGIGIACSICQMSEGIRTGAVGLFIGKPTTKDAWAASLDGTQTFYYSDVAQYYLGDPARFLFLQRSDGVAFYDYGWPTLAAQSTPTSENGVSTVPSMDIVKDFIRSKIAG